MKYTCFSVCACVCDGTGAPYGSGRSVKTHRDQLQGRTSIPLGVVTSLLRVGVCVLCTRVSDCANMKTKINLPEQHIPWQYMGHLLFLSFDTFLWVSFSVKKSLAVSNTLSQAIPVDGHVCVFGPFLMP